MLLLRYAYNKILYTLPIFFGVTFISYVLMFFFGADLSYTLSGKNPTAEDFDMIRHYLGHDRSLLSQYLSYLSEIFTLDFGHSQINNQEVVPLILRSLAVSFMLNIPGFILGNALAIFLALCCAHFKGQFFDKILLFFSSVGMSLTNIIVILIFQLLFCTSLGLNIFPVQGWDLSSFASYAYSVFIPMLASTFILAVHNLRFFRALFVEQMEKMHVRLARAMGWPARIIMSKYVLKNALTPVVVRIIFTIPFLIMEGSLLLETFFGVPGVGRVTFDAMTTGDLPVIKGLVGIGTFLYLLILGLADIFYKVIDPRIANRT